MRKKFEGLDSVFAGTLAQIAEAIPQAKPEPSSEIRATFIVERELLRKTKALAHWERKQIKQIVNEALRAYLARTERDRGPIQDIPN